MNDKPEACDGLFLCLKKGSGASQNDRLYPVKPVR